MEKIQVLQISKRLVGEIYTKEIKPYIPEELTVGDDEFPLNPLETEENLQFWRFLTGEERICWKLAKLFEVIGLNLYGDLLYDGLDSDAEKTFPCEKWESLRPMIGENGGVFVQKCSKIGGIVMFK